MAEVRPLQALHYNLGAIPSLADVTAPPYDVIDPRQRAELLARSPLNVVEIDLPQAPAGGDPYEHAAETLEAWTLQGVLTADREPAIWALTQDYQGPDGSRHTRRGFLARVRVTEYGPGLVRPHERTQPGPKEDRLRLTEATRHNLSPIFALHPGDAWRHIEPHLDADPWGEVTDPDGTVHRIWRVADPAVHEALAAELADAELLIADGHHRYETARVYADEIGGEGPHRYTLMCLVSLEDPGLTVFGTHRLLRDLDPDAQRAAGRGNTRALRDRGGGRGRPRSRRQRRRRRLRLHRHPASPRPPPAAQGHRGDRRGARRPLGGLPAPRRGDPRGADPQAHARACRTRTSPPSAGSATRRTSPRRWACSTRAPTRPPSCFAPRRSSRCARSPPTARPCPPSPPTSFPKVLTGVVFNPLS